MSPTEQVKEHLDDVFKKIMPLAEVERKTILGTMIAAGGNKLRAATLLGIGQSTLYRKLAEYGYPSCLQR